MPKQIDRNVILLGWVSFFTDMASAMITPMLPVFIVVVLHEGTDRLGLIIAIATFLSYALRLLSGYISDRFAIVKPLVISGYALSAFSKPFLAFSQGWKSVALLQGIERVGKGIRSAPKDVMIAHYSGRRREGSTFGFHKTLDIAGELCGTLLLFTILLFFGESEEILRTIFAATLLPGVAGLVLLFFVRDIPKAAVKPPRFELTCQDRSVVKMLGFYFVFVFFIFSDAFFTLRAIGTGFSTVSVPLLFIVSTLTQTFLSYPIGRLVDGYGVNKVLLGAFAAGIAAQALLAEGSHTSIWIAYMLLGFFTVASLNATRAYIAQCSDNRGSVYGIFYAGVALFASAGAAVCGFLWQHWGVESALFFSLTGTITVTVVFLFALSFDRHVH